LLREPVGLGTAHGRMMPDLRPVYPTNRR
jgi:hypothetical protein